MKRILKLVSISVVALATLTACDPPIPESLLVEQAERTVVCETGEVSVYLESGYSDLGYSWAEAALNACPEMVITSVEDPIVADLVASANPAPCEAIATTPLAFDSAAVVFYLEEAFSLNLSLEAISAIFSGEITDWGDQRIAVDNPDVDLSGIPVNVTPESTQPAIDAMQNWANRESQSETAFSALTATEDVIWADLLFSLEQGSIALVPMSEVLLGGQTPANVVLVDGTVLVPEQASFYAGASQFDFEATENSVVANFNPEKEPLPFPGTTEVSIPYQAAFPVNLNICGEDTILKRAVARYFLRLDAQGLIATSTVTALKEDMRVASAQVMGQGLPVPEIDPEALEG